MKFKETKNKLEKIYNKALSNEHNLEKKENAIFRTLEYDGLTSKPKVVWESEWITAGTPYPAPSTSATTGINKGDPCAVGIGYYFEHELENLTSGSFPDKYIPFLHVDILVKDSPTKPDTPAMKTFDEMIESANTNPISVGGLSSKEWGEIYKAQTPPGFPVSWKRRKYVYRDIIVKSAGRLVFQGGITDSSFKWKDYKVINNQYVYNIPVYYEGTNSGDIESASADVPDYHFPEQSAKIAWYPQAETEIGEDTFRELGALVQLELRYNFTAGYVWRIWGEGEWDYIQEYNYLEYTTNTMATSPNINSTQVWGKYKINSFANSSEPTEGEDPYYDRVNGTFERYNKIWQLIPGTRWGYNGNASYTNESSSPPGAYGTWTTEHHPGNPAGSPPDYIPIPDTWTHTFHGPWTLTSDQTQVHPISPEFIADTAPSPTVYYEGPDLPGSNDDSLWQRFIPQWEFVIDEGTRVDTGTLTKSFGANSNCYAIFTYKGMRYQVGGGPTQNPLQTFRFFEIVDNYPASPGELNEPDSVDLSQTLGYFVFLSDNLIVPFGGCSANETTITYNAPTGQITNPRKFTSADYKYKTLTVEKNKPGDNIVGGSSASSVLENEQSLDIWKNYYDKAVFNGEQTYILNDEYKIKIRGTGKVYYNAPASTLANAGSSVTKDYVKGSISSDEDEFGYYRFLPGTPDIFEEITFPNYRVDYTTPPKYKVLITLQHPFYYHEVPKYKEKT